MTSMDVALLFVMVIGFLLLGVPIAVSLGLSSMIFLLAFSDTSLASIAQSLYQAMAGHYTLLAIPFWIGTLNAPTLEVPRAARPQYHYLRRRPDVSAPRNRVAVFFGGLGHLLFRAPGHILACSFDRLADLVMRPFPEIITSFENTPSNV